MSTHKPAPEPVFLNLTAAAQLVGTSPRSIRRLIDRGELQPYRIGTVDRLVVKRADLLALVAPTPGGPA